MRFRILALTLVAAFAVTASALGARTGIDPKKIALRASDFPANAQRTYEKASASAPLPGGQTGRAYANTFMFPSGQKREIVVDIIIAGKSESHARAVYTGAVGEAKQANQSLQHKVLRLPAYGDEQYAALLGDVAVEETQVQLLVRKKTVVWRLYINTDLTAKDTGLSKSEALSELAKYAGKLKLRVGNG